MLWVEPLAFWIDLTFCGLAVARAGPTLQKYARNQHCTFQTSWRILFNVLVRHQIITAWRFHVFFFSTLGIISSLTFDVLRWLNQQRQERSGVFQPCRESPAMALQPRTYQLQCLEKIKIENTIISMPTGSDFHQWVNKNTDDVPYISIL